LFRFSSSIRSGEQDSFIKKRQGNKGAAVGLEQKRVAKTIWVEKPVDGWHFYTPLIFYIDGTKHYP
jgi:hypothetical protein